MYRKNNMSCSYMNENNKKNIYTKKCLKNETFVKKEQKHNLCKSYDKIRGSKSQGNRFYNELYKFIVK